MIRDAKRYGDLGATEMVVPTKDRTRVSITFYKPNGKPVTYDLDVRAKKKLDQLLKDLGIEVDTTPTGGNTVPTTPRP